MYTRLLIIMIINDYERLSYDYHECWMIIKIIMKVVFKKYFESFEKKIYK